MQGGASIPFLLAMAIGLPAMARSALPRATYHGSFLDLVFDEVEPRTVQLSWQVLSAAGSLVGRTRGQRVELKQGETRVRLQVGDAGAHYLRYQMGDQTYQMWANRGVWYVSTGCEKRLATCGSTSQGAPSDVALAPGVRVGSRGADGHLEIGRTLGHDTDAGVPITGAAGVVLVLHGDAGPLRVTLTQRTPVRRGPCSGPTSSRSKAAAAGAEPPATSCFDHWDYILVPIAAAARYVIPFARFRPRAASQGQLRNLQAVSLRSTSSLERAAFLEIDHLALASTAAHVRSMRRGPRGVTLSIQARGRLSERTIWAGEPGRPPQRVRRTPPVISASADRVWACYRADDGGSGCDPADAPSTTFTPPPRPGHPILVDGFATEAPLNTFRQPTLAFASTDSLERSLRVRRRRGSFQLRFQSPAPGAYAGYLTPLPERLPEGMRTVELVVAGGVSSREVRVGLRDASGREPRVNLRDYLNQLGSTAQTVRIPLEAFRATMTSVGGGPPRLSTLRSLSVTMVASGKGDYDMELQSVRLLPVSTPLTLINFDTEDAQHTALGGTVLVEGRNGARIEVRGSDPGMVGRGMGVTVSGVGGPAYGLVTLGLGLLDASGYHALRFYVRGGRGGESVAVCLSDLRHKAKVELGSRMTVTREWQALSLPLSLFRGKVDLRRLRQVTLAWEDRPVTEEGLWFDEFVFE